MSAMLQQHISHATGWSGMRMTANREANLYMRCCSAHAGICFKIKRISWLSESFDTDPTALIGTQWIYNALTSYLATPLSYMLSCTRKSVITSGEKYTFVKKLIIAGQVLQCWENLNAIKAVLANTWQANSHYFWRCWSHLALFFHTS